MPIATRDNLVRETSELELAELLESAVDPSADPATWDSQRQTRLGGALQAGDDELSKYLPAGVMPTRSALPGFAVRFAIAEAVYWLRCTTKGRSVPQEEIELADQRAKSMEKQARQGKLLGAAGGDRHAEPQLVEWDSPHRTLGGYSTR